MEVIYNVKNIYKGNNTKTKEEKKQIFNKKLLNIIIKLENNQIGLNNS